MSFTARYSFLALVPVLFLLNGCASSTSSSNNGSGSGSGSGSPAVKLLGSVMDGTQPIVGAHVYLMAAGTTGYNTASTSLLNASATPYSDAVGSYVISGTNGGFTISGYQCTSGQDIYLLATAGHIGSGSENAATSLIAVLGQCPANADFSGTIPSVVVNEVTTIAGVYALGGFMTDMKHVSSSGTSQAKIGIANAFLTAGLLADVTVGTARTTTPAGNGTVPQSKLDLLANILASCVESSANCSTLFTNATNDGTSSGTAPTETTTAMANIAHNPGVNVTNLIALQAAQPPYQPAATAAQDLTIALNYTGGGIVLPGGVAIDSQGNAWSLNRSTIHNGVAVGNSVSKISAGTGAAASPAVTGYVVPGMLGLQFFAIDSSDNLWTLGLPPSSSTTSIVVKLKSDGTSAFSAGSTVPPASGGIAIDPQGNGIVVPNGTGYRIDALSGSVSQLTVNGSATSFAVAVAPGGSIWYGRSGASSQNPGLGELSNTGTILFPSQTQPFQGQSGLANAIAMAIDHQGNIWAGNGGTVNGVQQYGIAEFSSTGQLLKSTSPGFPIATSGIAIDGAGNVFATDSNNRVFKYIAAKQALTLGYTDSSLNGSVGTAVDGSGNVWVSNVLGGGSLTEFVGLGAPVVTPIAAGVANNTLGTEP